MKFIKLFQKYLESVGEHTISDVDKYTTQMAAGYIDKLFFLDKLKNIDCIVDFGCANGFILSKIQEMRPDIKLIGYDLDKGMLEKAKEVLSDAILTDDWNTVKESIRGYKNAALCLSSVIHEVYSYSYSSNIKKFWEQQVFGSNFKYVCIRDMIPSVEVGKAEWSTFKEDIKKVNKKANKKLLFSFENRWGMIDDNYRTFLHFLLKYKYVENWTREVNENYLPVSLEWMKTKIPSNYHITYEEDFILSYLQEEVSKDFDIEIKHSTHTKMIIERG